MKYLIILTFFLISCTKESDTLPLPDKCSIAYTEVNEYNVDIIILSPLDTIHFGFYHESGYVKALWVRSEIDFDCIGFSRKEYDTYIDIWTDNESCTFLIPML